MYLCHSRFVRLSFHTNCLNGIILVYNYSLTTPYCIYETFNGTWTFKIVALFVLLVNFVKITFLNRNASEKLNDVII